MQESERNNEEPLAEDEENVICSNHLLAAMRERMAKRKNGARNKPPKEQEPEKPN